MAQIIGTYTADTATITAGKNLGFKLGLEKNLLASSFTATEGVFYLTSDTHRLFIGLKDGNVAPVNQGVISVSSLPSTSGVIPGQFYYITGSNILATFNGTEWVQINPDTYLNAMTHSVAASGSNGAVINTSATNAGGKNNTVTTSTGVTIVGGGENKVTVSGNTITITDAAYGMSTSGTNESGININLTKTPAGGTEAVEDSVSLKGSGGLKLSQANGIITIDASTVSNATTNNSIKSAAFTADTTDGGFKLTLTKNDGSTVPATLNPTIKYGSSETSVKFVDGTADLDVYSIAETDKKIADALMNYNALVYRGTVGGSTATVADLPQSGVQNGDVYLATGSGTLKTTSTGTAKSYDAGTLFIATGTETNGTIPANGVTWTVVQNFNTDTKTKVDLITKGIKISDYVTGGSTTTLGSFVVDSGSTDIITATESTSGTTKTVKIAHAQPTFQANTVEVPTATSTDLFVGKALGSLTGDKYGHLTSTTEELIKVPAETFKSTTVTETVAVANNKATMSHALTLKNSSTNADISTATVTSSVTSDNLTLTAASNVLSINLVWGSF